MPPSAMKGTPLARNACATSATAEICGTPTPATTRVVQIEPGPMPTLTPSAPAATSASAASAVTTLPPMTCMLRMRFLDASHAVQYAFREPVGSVHDDDVHAGLDQRVDAIVGVVAGAHGRADTQRTALILAGARVVLCFLEILRSDHAFQFEAVADHQHLLDAVTVQQRQHLVLGRLLADRDQPVLRGHHCRYRRIQLGFEAQVTMRDDAHGLLAADDGHARDAQRLGQIDDFADGHVRIDGDRVAHDAGFELLDAEHLARLFLDRHVLVDDADAAFLRERDGQP